SVAPATITPSEGSLLIHPTSATAAVVLVVSDASGPMLDRLFDVEVTARTTITTGELSAMSNASDARSGYACGMASSGSGGIGSDNGTSGSTYQFPLSSPHVNPDLLVRLTPPDALNSQIDCRLAYGVAVGLYTYPPFSPPAGGRPGVRVVTDDADLDGFALYHYQPGVPCAPPIIR
ncbi:MAG TPA: hypothetical protein VLB44_04355, partial [Kofleriaceae bacterium]|nr:hypothetical protein [Kofleriaceae bacterium]